MRSLLFFSLLSVLSFSVHAQADEKLFEQMKDPKKFEIFLRDLPPIKAISVEGRTCILGAEPGAKSFQSASLARKINNGVVTWKLYGTRAGDLGSCANGMEFSLNSENEFVALKKVGMTQVISKYAEYSCLIKDSGYLKGERNLTQAEADAVAECFISDKNQNVRDVIMQSCGRDLFQKNAKTLNCQKSFLEMALESRSARLGEVEDLMCRVDVGGYGAAKSIVICPLDSHTVASVSGHSEVYYGVGNCLSKQSSGCHKVERQTPSFYNSWLPASAPSADHEKSTKTAD